MPKVSETMKLITSCWNIYLAVGINISSEAYFNFFISMRFLQRFPENSLRWIPPREFSPIYFLLNFLWSNIRSSSLFIYFFVCIHCCQVLHTLSLKTVTLSPFRPGMQGNESIRFQDFIYFHLFPTPEALLTILTSVLRKIVPMLSTEL